MDAVPPTHLLCPPPAQAVPDADFPAESLVDFIAAQMKPEFDWKVRAYPLTHFLGY